MAGLVSCLVAFFALSGAGWFVCEPEEGLEGVYCLCRGRREKCERAQVIEARCPDHFSSQVKRQNIFQREYFYQTYF